MNSIKNNRDERDIFFLPPNFLNEGSLFGGMLKLRNAIEAVVSVVGITVPVLKITALSFTGRVIVWCLTALPIGIFAVIGIGGESLTAFLMNFFRYLRNRRVHYRTDAVVPRKRREKWFLSPEGEWPEEFDEKPKRKEKRQKKDFYPG